MLDYLENISNSLKILVMILLLYITGHLFMENVKYFNFITI